RSHHDAAETTSLRPTSADAHAAPDEEAADGVAEEASEAAEPEEGAAAATASSGATKEFSDTLNSVLEAIGDPYAIHDFMRAIAIRPHLERAGVLRTSLITSAVAAFEVLLASVATQFFKLHNDA